MSAYTLATSVDLELADDEIVFVITGRCGHVKRQKTATWEGRRFVCPTCPARTQALMVRPMGVA